MTPNPIPLPWVESLFSRLIVAWGRDFLAQYTGTEIALVHDDWAQKLAGLQVATGDEVDVPAIWWALENLPEKPLNAIGFRKLCNAYHPPAGHPLGLPAPPREVPEKFRKAIAQLAVPLDDTRPEKVRVAYRFIEKWGTKGVRLSPYKQKTLTEMRSITRQWELEQAARRTDAKESSNAA